MRVKYTASFLFFALYGVYYFFVKKLSIMNCLKYRMLYTILFKKIKVSFFQLCIHFKNIKRDCVKFLHSRIIFVVGIFLEIAFQRHDWSFFYVNEPCQVTSQYDQWDS